MRKSPHFLNRFLSNVSRIGVAISLVASLGAGVALCSCSSSSAGQNGQEGQGGKTEQPQRPEVPAQLEEVVPDTDYDSFDVTGDGQPDTLRIDAVEGKYGFLESATVTVNGEEALALDGRAQDLWYYTVSANFIMTSNGYPFLQIVCHGEDDTAIINSLYQYKDDKLVEAKNLLGFYDEKFGTHQNAEVAAVNEHNIAVRYSMMSFILGYGFAGTFDYDVDDEGALTQVSNQSSKFDYIADMQECNQDSDVCYKLNESVTAYAEPMEAGKSTKLKAGAKLAPKATFVQDGDTYVQFKEEKSGSLYWIHATEMPGTDGKTLLDGVMYAG